MFDVSVNKSAVEFQDRKRRNKLQVAKCWTETCENKIQRLKCGIGKMRHLIDEVPCIAVEGAVNV